MQHSVKLYFLFVCLFVLFFAASGISMHACLLARTHVVSSPGSSVSRLDGAMEARFRRSRRAGQFSSFGKEHARAKGAREQCAGPRRRTTARGRLSWVPATPCAAPRALASLSLSVCTGTARCTVHSACMHLPCPHSDTALNLQYIYYYMYCPSSNNPTWLHRPKYV
jgi:hypothetical protein